MQRRFSASAPKTLNEKILFKMAFDRRPILSTLADKAAVRDYVETCVGASVLVKVYGVYDSPEEFLTEEFPDRFVVKPTHGSCAVIIVDDRATSDGRLLTPSHRTEWCCGMSHVRKGALKREAFTELSESWLRNRYSSVRESAYRGIPARLIVEELLEGPDGGVPPDYKFWCFEGRVGFVQVDLDRFSRHTRSLHRPDWRPIDATILYPKPEVVTDAPERLAEMLEVAEALASGLDFVRVDLYATRDRVVFGEMTNYPEAGTGTMRPESVLSELGAEWRPELHYGPR
jgi:hypothetical protein